jgi:hypothetical protein
MPVMSAHIRIEALAFGQIILAFSQLKDSPALQQAYDQNNQSDDQKHMNQAADVERKKSQSPQNDQNN